MATALAIVAIVISILAAIASARISYQVAGSGFRVSENLLSDLATLLAALRSVASKGAIVMGEQRTGPIPIDVELETVRSFASSTSGLAIAIYAGRVGSAGASDDSNAGAWRILRFHFANLGAMHVTSGADNQAAGRLALEIERTLSSLNKSAIRQIRREMKNLPEVLSSLESSRQQDILLRALENVIPRKGGDMGIERLRQLKDSGVEDPDIDMFLAIEDDKIEEVKNALDRGANPNVTVGEVLSRYEDNRPDPQKRPTQ